MMKRIGVFIFLVAIGLLILPLPGLAQARPIKGEVVYLKVPTSLFGYKVLLRSWNCLTAEVKPSGDGVTVNGQVGWQTMAFPPMTEHKIRMIKDNSANKDWPSGSTTVELTLSDALTLRFYFPKGQAAKLFPQVFATKDEVDPYRANIYKILAAKFFDGTPLASLTDSQKHDLCMFANVTANGSKMGAVTNKDNLYLLVDIGRDTVVYNDLKLNQVQRVAKIINERLLAVLKAFTIPVKDELNIFGLKLEFLIPHKSFLDESAEPSNDKLEIYAPIDLILSFADAEITSQEFIDKCIVIVESNRISVPLASY